MLKQETIGLGIMLELPLLILDIQRAGPSTGMPTKPEQADLLMVMFGRNSESPVPVLAASTPSQCFHAAIEAARIALKYRTPVYLLSDAYLANGSEPWLIPNVADLPDISTEFAAAGDGEFMPYARDPETLARPWAIPGTPGLEHRIGGLEKADVTGSISYDPENHDLMTRLRAAKVAGIANDIPCSQVDDPDGADTLVLGWGSTYGPIGAAVRRVREERAPDRAGAPALPEPVPAQHRRGAAQLREDPDPGDEPRPAVEARPRRVPRRRGRLQPRARHAVQGVRARRCDHGAGGVMRPKKKTPDQRGLLLKERPFSYRARRDGTVEILWKGRHATTLAGKIAEKFLEVAPTEDEQGQQLLMAKATGNFKRGNERKR